MKITKCNQDFGRFIRLGREKQGLYQEDVARAAGITQTYYSFIETGKRNVDLSLAIKLCDILCLDINSFVELQKKKKYRL